MENNEMKNLLSEAVKEFFSNANINANITDEGFKNFFVSICISMVTSSLIKRIPKT